TPRVRDGSLEYALKGQRSWISGKLHRLTTALPFQGAEIGCLPIPWALSRAGRCAGPSARKTGRGDFTNKGPNRHTLAARDSSRTDETAISTLVRSNRMNQKESGCLQFQLSNRSANPIAGQTLGLIRYSVSWQRHQDRN